MARARATINGGVCGFVSEVAALSDDSQQVRFEITSPCEKVRALAERLPEVDAYAEVGAGFDGEIWAAIRASLRGCCAGCVVPAGLFKVMQVAAGLALPREASIGIERLAR